jgi:hypothetical protein
MIEAGAPSTEDATVCYPKRCARPTGGSHGRTGGSLARRFKGANRTPHQSGVNSADLVVSQGELRRMEVRRTSEKSTSIAFCDYIDPCKPWIDERLRSCCDKRSVLLKYAASANSVPPMKPLSFPYRTCAAKKRTAHEDGRVGCSEDVSATDAMWELQAARFGPRSI